MKCQILFSRKTKKNIISLLSVEFAHIIKSVNLPLNVISTVCLVVISNESFKSIFTQ